MFDEWTCYLEVRRYATNGNVSLVLFDVADGTPIAKATVNTAVVLPDTHVAIKHYSENEGMVEALLAADIIQGAPTARIPLAFDSVPVYMLGPVAYALVKQLAPFNDKGAVL